MGIFKTITIYITDETYDNVSECIRIDMETSLKDGSSNDYIIDLAYDLQLIEMAHSEGIVTYDEDDKFDTLDRLTGVLKIVYSSVMWNYLNEEKIMLEGVSKR